MYYIPYEVGAVSTEGGLAQDGGHELVPVALVDAPAHGPPPLPVLEGARALLEHALLGLLRRVRL